MYLEHFRFKVKPFQITADPKFLWMGEKHKEALATLRYGILDNRGFLLLTGEVGTGKTILINRLVTMLDIDTAVATLPDPDLESMDFYNLLAHGLKMNRTFNSKGSFLIHLRDYLHQSHADGKQVLLIIDESQRLNHRLMEDIRVLSNIELHDRKLINIFFVGQPEFNSILRAPQNRALAQRITVRYNIEPLDRSETGIYIIHRIKVAGGDGKIFNSKAVDEIYRFSNGIPRLINIVCDHALLTGYANGLKHIDGKVIQECARELHIPSQTQQPPPAYKVDGSSVSGADGDMGDATILKSGPHWDTESETSGPGHTADSKISHPNRSFAWKLTYTAMVLFLFAIVIFAIHRFTGNDQPRWNADELTPQKYKTSLEKELLANRLQENTGETGQADQGAPKTAADSDETAPASESSITWGQIRVPETEKTDSAHTTKQDISSDQNKSSVPVPVEDGGKTEQLPFINEKIVITFDINSNEIDSQSFAILDSIAAHMVHNPDQIIHLRGYTDASGASGYNESVSRFRASAVKSYLIGKGVLADNIIIFAMGSVDPIASNESLTGRRKNRRVEIEFLQKQGQ
jgi:general secretion pathway protein A